MGNGQKITITLSNETFDHLVTYVAGSGCSVELEAVSLIEVCLDNLISSTRKQFEDANKPKRPRNSRPTTSKQSPSPPQPLTSTTPTHTEPTTPTPTTPKRTRTKIDPEALSEVCDKIVKVVEGPYAIIGATKSAIRANLPEIAWDLVSAALRKLVKDGRLKLVGKKYFPPDH